MITLEFFDGVQEASVQIFLDKFLTLWLDDDIGIVFGLMLVVRSTESND